MANACMREPDARIRNARKPRSAASGINCRRMARMLEYVGGLWCLFMLALRSGFRMNSAYWRWRNETAFGRDPATRPPLRQRLLALLDYGRWVHRMKRGL